MEFDVYLAPFYLADLLKSNLGHSMAACDSQIIKTFFLCRVKQRRYTAIQLLEPRS